MPVNGLSESTSCRMPTVKVTARTCRTACAAGSADRGRAARPGDQRPGRSERQRRRNGTQQDARRCDDGSMDGHAGLRRATVRPCPHLVTSTRVPEAPRSPVVHVAHGVERSDDYAWLGTLTIRKRWSTCVTSVATTTSPWLICNPSDGHWPTRCVSRTPVADSSVRWRRGGHFYYTQPGKGEEYERLFPSSPGRDRDSNAGTVLDLNELAAGHDLPGVGLIEPSPDGRLLAYSVDLVGDEVFELRFRDLRHRPGPARPHPADYYSGAWSRTRRLLLHRARPGIPTRPRPRHRLEHRRPSSMVAAGEPDRRFELRSGGARSTAAGRAAQPASRDTTEVYLVRADGPAGAAAARGRAAHRRRVRRRGAARWLERWREDRLLS